MRVSRRDTASKPRALSSAQVDASATRDPFSRMNATVTANCASLDALLEEKEVQEWDVAARASGESWDVAEVAVQPPLTLSVSSSSL